MVKPKVAKKNNAMKPSKKDNPISSAISKKESAQPSMAMVKTNSVKDLHRSFYRILFRFRGKR